MPGPEIEKIGPDSVQDQLREIESTGLMLSDDVRRVLEAGSENNLNLLNLKDMAENYKRFKDLQDVKIAYPKPFKDEALPIDKKDIKWVDRATRRIGRVSEIEEKANTMKLVVEKYGLIHHIALVDKLANMGHPQEFATLRPSDIKKVHGKPLEEAISWMKNHRTRMDLLMKLIIDRAVPPGMYESYRGMPVEKALEKLNEIKKASNERTTAFADKMLKKDLSELEEGSSRFA